MISTGATRIESTAVIVVDMQPYFCDWLLPNIREQLVKAQLEVIRKCRERDIPILVLQYEGCERTLVDLAREVEKAPRRKFIKKCNPDGFYLTSLNDDLKRFCAQEIVLMGVNASGCVLATGLTAHKLGYTVHTAENLMADTKRRSIQDYAREWYEKTGNLNRLPEVCI